MTRLRTKPAELGTCLGYACKAQGSGIVSEWIDPATGQVLTRQDSLCKKHRAAREIELHERNARGEVAQVIRLDDYARDPDTRAGSVWRIS